ncbi:MAG: quinoprotein dehydrogenase-associated SoxYZ-like carrier [Pseudomonadota bacterium]|nr:quinoprotein dehydrogenase-associated SoxYZ-like carrier [Pseudomonadota bacterium]
MSTRLPLPSRPLHASDALARRQWLRAATAVTGAAWLLSPGAHAQALNDLFDGQGDPDQSPRWRMLHDKHFGARPVNPAPLGSLSLQVPARAADPAFVPVVVRSTGVADAIRRLTLVVDENPSPVAAIIDFPEGGALPEFETRMRVDAYSFVRAVAETRSGQLLASARYVKASGGCAAPGPTDAESLAHMGRMHFQADGPATPGQPLRVTWRISHPNHSGLARDQLTLHHIPAHFVRQLRLYQGQRLLLLADLDFALSENPSLRFAFVPQGTDDVRAEVEDSQGQRFSGGTPLAALLQGQGGAA